MKKTILLFLAGLATLPGMVLAQGMSAEIDARATEMTELRARLNNPNKDVSLAALDVMLKSKETAIREVAYRQAFSGNDLDMITIALKNKFNDLRVMSFNIDKSASNNEEFKQIEPLTVVRVDKFLENDGSMYLDRNTSRNANLSGTQFIFNLHYSAPGSFTCNGELAYTSNATLEGRMVCNNVTFPVSIKVF